MNPDWAPNNKTDNNLLALSCIYVPMDGMNEKGLYIANLNNDGDALLPDTSDTTKKYVQTTVAIRYILDKCATVTEAVNWLKTIVMCPVYGDMVDANGEAEYYDYHYAIADNSGNSVVVEWINGKMEIVDTWIVTNHSLVRNNTNTDEFATNYDEDDYSDKEHTVPRFMSLKSARKPQMSEQQVKEALSNVQQKYSVWSAVFEPGAKRVTYYFRKADPEAGVDPNDEDARHEARHHPIDYTKPVVIQF